MMTKVTFKISYIRVRRGEVLGVTGSCPELGEWNKPVLLDDKDFPVWKGSVTIKGNAEYKFVIADKAAGVAIPRYYWRYRMHLTLEELLGKADFNRKVLELVTDCGR